MISLIYAKDKNNLIGKGNDLPWYYSSDLKYFKEKTSNKTVVMGKNTFDSIISRLGYPLPNRKNVVVTTNKFFKYHEVEVINDFKDYLEKNKNTDEEIFVIGGKKIYEFALDYANSIYETYIDETHLGDVYLDLNLEKFKIEEEKVIDKLHFRKYVRYS